MFEDLLPAVERGIIDAAGSIPVVFKGIERTFEKGTTQTEPSRHEYHELTYMRSGRAEFEIAGRAVKVEKGGTVVIHPNTSHTIKVLNGHADMLVLYFGFSRPGKANVAPQTMDQFIHFVYGEDADTRDSDPYILIRGKSRQEIVSLAERIMREKRRTAYGRDLMMQLLAMELLVALARGLREEWEESLRVRHGKARELVHIARDYIADNYDRDISVADAAGYVFLSQGYFTRAFREETGMSPMSFLMQIRVEHACRLLAYRDIKVSGIAEKVGFSSPQRFNAAFRKYMSMTPMSYRRKLAGKNQIVESGVPLPGKDQII